MVDVIFHQKSSAIAFPQKKFGHQSQCLFSLVVISRGSSPLHQVKRFDARHSRLWKPCRSVCVCVGLSALVTLASLSFRVVDGPANQCTCHLSIIPLHGTQVTLIKQWAHLGLRCVSVRETERERLCMSLGVCVCIKVCVCVCVCALVQTDWASDEARLSGRLPENPIATVTLMEEIWRRCRGQP